MVSRLSKIFEDVAFSLSNLPFFGSLTIIFIMIGYGTGHLLNCVDFSKKIIIVLFNTKVIV